MLAFYEISPIHILILIGIGFLLFGLPLLIVLLLVKKAVGPGPLSAASSPARRSSPLSIVMTYFAGTIAGGLIGAGVTYLGALCGGALENALGVMLNWEFSIFAIGLFNISGGLLSGMLGVMSKRPLRGLLIGVVLHGIIFGAYILSSDSLQAAPASVNQWVLALGLIAGALAGLLGGTLGRGRL
jgi:hypothetical protein